jgi:hypothetical protein
MQSRRFKKASDAATLLIDVATHSVIPVVLRNVLSSLKL